MKIKCSQCLTGQSTNHYTCEQCGTELIENGTLVDALTYWDVNKTSDIATYLIPLGLAVIAGVAAAMLHTNIIAVAGVAAAAIFYYFRSTK
jgi:hypothetical protein